MDTTSAAFEGVPSLPSNYFSDNTNSFNTNIINNYGVEGPPRVPESFQEVIRDTHWWVSPPEIDLDHLRDKHNLPEAGTGEWIFQDAKYTEWKGGGKSQLLWLCGGPGTGKTMLAKSVAAEFLKELEDPPNGVKLVFYFVTPELLTDMTSADEANPSRFLLAKVARDLLYSILYQDGNLFSGCKAELKMQGDKFFNNPSSLWKVLKKAVHDCQTDHVYILIDGVDGLKESLCKELIERILGLADTSKIKIFLSSRAVPHVANNLSGHMKINLDENDFVKEDVKTFIKRRVKKLKEWDRDQKGRVKEVLIARAGGIYLWASLAIGNLACLSSGPDFETFLKRLPTQLEDVYRKMLRSLMQREGSQKVLEMIRSVALALRPLTFGELGHILACMEEEERTERQSSHGETSTEIQIKTEEEVKKYVQSSLGFLRITATTVSIVHNTATRYLFDEMRKDGLPILSKAESDLSISWECFQYLHRALGDPEKFPRGDIKTNHNKSQDPSSEKYCRDGELRETPWEVARMNPPGAVAKWPYLRYAAEFWFIHARRSIEVSGDKFYDESSRNWLQYQFFETGDVIRKPWVGLCRDPKMEALVGDQAPVHIAVSLGLMPLVEKALPDLAEPTESNWSLLPLAAKFTSQAYKILIDKGSLSFLTAPDQDGNTPLHQAVIFGHWPMLKGLVEKFEKSGDKACSKEIDKKNHSGNTPLHLAVQFDHPDIAELLVKKGADQSIRNNDQMTASELETKLGRADSSKIPTEAKGTQLQTEEIMRETVGKPVEPGERAAEKPVEKHVREPVEKSVERPTEGLVGESAEEPARKTARKTAKKAAGKAAGGAARETARETAGQPVEELIEEIVGEPARETEGETGGKPVEKPTRKGKGKRTEEAAGQRAEERARGPRREPEKKPKEPKEPEKSLWRLWRNFLRRLCGGSEEV